MADNKEPLITLTPIGSGCMQVTFHNGVSMGDFLVGDDGYWVWWPIQRNGFIGAYILRELADQLDALNAPWDKIVQEAKWDE